MLTHSFATHLLGKGTDIMMIGKLLGHNDIKTTLRYLHVTNRDLIKIISPIDDLNLDGI
jgi:integrase/recombinase XerD